MYVTPEAGAKPEIYDPLKNAEQIVLDALNVGALQMNRRGANEVPVGFGRIICVSTVRQKRSIA